jgi:hypothetical protein
MTKKLVLKDVEIILEGLDENNITSILDKYVEICNIRKKLDALEEMLKSKVKIFLKEKNWTRYLDSTNKISVSLLVQKREDFNRQQLKFILSESQYAQVLKITTFEKLLITTPEDRKRLTEYVRN